MLHKIKESIERIFKTYPVFSSRKDALEYAAQKIGAKKLRALNRMVLQENDGWLELYTSENGEIVGINEKIDLGRDEIIRCRVFCYDEERDTFVPI